MKRVILALVLLTMSTSLNAVTLLLASHQFNNGNGIQTSIPDGFSLWDWDGTSVTSIGIFSSSVTVGGPINQLVYRDEASDMSFDLSKLKAFASSYSCVEGTFGTVVDHSFCGGYNFGSNFMNDSTTTWGPGTAVSQTIGGDDVLADGPRTFSGAFDGFGFISATFTPINQDGTGDFGLVIGNGMPIGSAGGEVLFFAGLDVHPGSLTGPTVVPIPAVAWLFGSALGLLGWMRRKVT